jgi:hypothetical protein
LLVFPLAALLNSFSMTALLLVVGITGRSELAADVGLVQGATLAMFYAFSANARNLILADVSGNVAIQLLQTRFILLLPLAGAAYFLSVGVGNAAALIAAVLIVRRIAEWLGEIGLARHEQLNQPEFALQTVAAECASLFLCLALTLWFDVDLATSALLWMLVPLLAVRRAQMTLQLGRDRLALGLLLPHFGSTAIIGMTVYVFRISIAILVGKSVAGELFTAFAMGGIIPTIFGQALAPTLAHRFAGVVWPKWLLALPASMLLAAGGITALSITEPEWLLKFGRTPTFWMAVGLSIAGGAIMTVAASWRTKLIHRADGREVFGADLLANVLIAISAPFVYYMLGTKSLAGLYALSACLSLGFLWRAGREPGHPMRRGVLLTIGMLLVSPVFFQLNGGLFNDPAFVFETGRAILRLPIPLSVLSLFTGIALLGNYGAATRSLTALFFSAVLLVMSSLIAAQGDKVYESAKLILLAQFLLPMFGLVLGQMFGAESQEPIFEHAALMMLLIVIPAQLAASWMQGYALLGPQVLGFSIYQHLLYFPMVVVALVMLVMPSMGFGSHRRQLLVSILLPLLAIHIVASLSVMAIAGFLAALVALALVAIHERKWVRQTLGIALIAVLAGAAYWPMVSTSYSTAITVSGQANRTGEFARPVAQVMEQKADHWWFYSRGIVESPRSFLFGHATPPDRARYPSAQNYWLDVLYNFGALAIVPLIALLIWTGRALWQRRAEVLDNRLLFGAAMATAYLLLGENMLKVGMRQPYPGIITFFIWGLLIARLRGIPEPPEGAGMIG